MNKYKIVDWMNNRIFPNKVFKTFEDGWEYIYNKFDNEEDHQEYFVVNVNEKERGQIWKLKTTNQSQKYWQKNTNVNSIYSWILKIVWIELNKKERTNNDKYKFLLLCINFIFDDSINNNNIESEV